jgi:hypothetical protein
LHHWKKGGHRNKCKKLREAATTAENEPAPKKKEDDDANDGKQTATTANATTSTSTTTTARSLPLSPLPPQNDEEPNATKGKTNKSNDDGL